MFFTNVKESRLESLLVNWLVNHNGYEQGQNRDYNTEYALDTTRLFRFLKNTRPDAMKKRQLETNPQKTAQFLARVRDEITKRGIVDVLRKGIKAYPASLIMFYMTPSVNNPAAAALSRTSMVVRPIFWDGTAPLGPPQTALWCARLHAACTTGA